MGWLWLYPRMPEHVENAWNYFYRGLIAVTVVAKVFGDKPLVDIMYEYLERFTQSSGERANIKHENET
jgi:hypothetical protein